MGAAMPDLKICYALKGIRLGRGEKARGQIVIGTPGTTMDWTVKHRSIDPNSIKVRPTFIIQNATCLSRFSFLMRQML